MRSASVAWRASLGMSVLLAGACSNDDGPDDTLRPCDGEAPIVLDRDAVEDLGARLDQEGEILLAQIPCTDLDRPSPRVALVLKRPGGELDGLLVREATTGRFVEEESDGVDPPAYRSPTGDAAIGYLFQSSAAFAFAATAVPAATFVLRASGEEHRLDVPPNGVVDLTGLWADAQVPGERFVAEWLDPDGDILTTVEGEFYGRIH